MPIYLLDSIFKHTAMKLNKTSGKMAFIILMTFPLLFSTTIPANETWHTSLPRAIRLAQKTSRPIVLDIYAPWCPYCRKMQGEVYPSSSIKKLLDDFVLVRIDGEKNRPVSAKYRVTGFPTIVFLDKNGKKISINRGFTTKSAMKTKLMEILAYVQQEKDLIKQLKSKPYSVYLNYKAGVMHYQKADLDRAEKSFLKANASTEQVSLQKIDALYNLAVVYMDKKDYRSAVKRWNEYIRKYPNQGQDSVYARYYRGISLYFLSDKTSAKSDLVWAVKNLENRADRKSANQLLKYMN